MALRLNCCLVSWIALILTFSSPGHATTKKLHKIKVAQVEAMVEFAMTPQEITRGLMFRDKLGPNEGMLFFFENEQTLSFWMKNTVIDLSIAFIDRNKTIVDIKEMKATKPTDINIPSYESAKPAKFALEMNKG